MSLSYSWSILNPRYCFWYLFIMSLLLLLYPFSYPFFHKSISYPLYLSLILSYPLSSLDLFFLVYFSYSWSISLTLTLYSIYPSYSWSISLTPALLLDLSSILSLILYPLLFLIYPLSFVFIIYLLPLIYPLSFVFIIYPLYS